MLLESALGREWSTASRLKADLRRPFRLTADERTAPTSTRGGRLTYAAARPKSVRHSTRSPQNSMRGGVA